MAETGVLEPVTVVGETFSKEVKDINGEELKSADLADALSRNSASITLIRGSAVANDVILRGQKRDNINVLMDDAKIYGGCPNRMDPAITHINSDNMKMLPLLKALMMWSILVHSADLWLRRQKTSEGSQRRSECGRGKLWL